MVERRAQEGCAHGGVNHNTLGSMNADARDIFAITLASAAQFPNGAYPTSGLWSKPVTLLEFVV